MKNEIKEILEYLKDKNDYIEDFGIKYKRIHIDNGDLKILLDYITSLEQENERLKDSKDWWKDRFFAQQEYDDSHRITAIEYKKRIYKAIDYIKKYCIDDEFYINLSNKEKAIIEVLNILEK